jgi:uncharacterized protein DUF4232
VTLAYGLAAALLAIVPWVDERPPTAAAHPPLAAPCLASALHARLFLQGATGSLVGGVTLLNAGTRPCALVGRPAVSFGAPAAARAKWRVKRLAASTAPPDVLADPPGSLRALRPGKSASVTVYWSNWCGPPPRALRLALASGTTIAIALARAPRCDAPQAPSTVAVGPFMPAERHLPASSRLPLRAAIVGVRPIEVKPGLRAFRAHRGRPFRYVVALTNAGSRTFRFARTSCPTYIEQVGLSHAEAYLLNCRPVPSISPNETVRFAMQITIPAQARLGNESLTWELAPRTYDPPFTPAALWVAR